MVDTTGLSSTESITRFLRHKNTKIEDVYEVSSDLLSNNSTLFLPEKESFILKLICDKFSQKQFQSFRNNGLMWDLLAQVWIKMDENKTQRTTRDKNLSAVKLNEIISSTLEDILNNDKLRLDGKILESLVKVLQLVLKDHKLSLSDDQSITVIELLFNFIESTELETLKLELCNIVHKVFKLNNTKVTKYGKKQVTQFFTSCLANLLSSLQLAYVKQDEAIRSSLEEILYEVLLSKANIINLEVNLEYFINKPNIQEKVTDESIHYLFKLLIPKLSIAALENIFKTLSSKFTASSGSLLQELVGMNKSLSTEFLSPLVENALKANPVNYQVIIQALQKNSDVGNTFSTEILKVVSKDESKAFELLVSLLNCYVRSREIPEFFKTWIEFISSNNLKETDVLVSEKFSNEVSRHVITLSQIQLTRLTEELMNSYQNSPSIAYSVALISITSGLLNGVTGSHNVAVVKTLINNLAGIEPVLYKVFQDGYDKNRDTDWKLKSLVLMLYGLEDLPISFRKVIETKCFDCKYYYISVFRIYEQKVELADEGIMKAFLKYFHTSEKNSKIMIFSRWFVLLSSILSSSELYSLVADLLNDLSVTELNHVLRNGLLQEESQLIQAIISCIVKEIEKGNSCFADSLNLIPVYCYKKNQREEALNALLKISQISEAGIISRNCILDLLIQPTFKSNVESNLNSLIELVESSDKKDTLELSLKIVNIVLTLHLRQLHDTSSSKFISKSYKTLCKQISSFKSKKDISFNGLLNVAMCLVSVDSSTDHKSELVSILESRLLKLLGSSKSEFSENDISWLINNICEFSNESILEKKDKFKKIIRDQGLLYKSSVGVKGSLFKLVVKLSSAYSFEYVLALFLNLEVTQANTESITTYLSDLNSRSSESYLNCWTLAITNSEIGTQSIELLTSFLGSASKTEDLSDVHKLATKTISIILDNSYTCLNSPDTLIRTITCLKNLIASKSWILTQYSVELILLYPNMITQLLIQSLSSNVPKDTLNKIETIYIQCTQIVSNLLLFQRFRFSSRQHLLMETFETLMEALFEKGQDSLATTIIASSQGCSQAYQRLMGNLCEIYSSKQQQSNKYQDSSMSNPLAIFKSHLRKSLPVLIFNYLKFYIRFRLRPELREYLVTGLFLAFDLFTTNELNYINVSLDNQSRVIFRALYDDYKKFGKWKED